MSSQFSFPRPAIPPTAESVFGRLREQQREIELELEAEGKVTVDWLPPWYVHLPTGEKRQIKTIARRGSLLRFTEMHAEGSYIYIAPTALVMTIEPLPADSQGFPVEFLDVEDSPEESDPEGDLD